MNPNEPAHAGVDHACTPFTERVHAAIQKETLADFFHYKIAVGGFQTFTKCVLCLGNIL